jgi:hypothetical protein
MDKTLLTGVAALLMATSATHATVKLPDTITGNWCFLKDIDPNHAIYARVHTSGDCHPADNLIHIDQEGAEGKGSCIFDKMKQTRANVFLIYSRCDFGKAGAVIFEIIDEKLDVTVLPEG